MPPLIHLLTNGVLVVHGLLAYKTCNVVYQLFDGRFAINFGFTMAGINPPWAFVHHFSAISRLNVLQWPPDRRNAPADALMAGFVAAAILAAVEPGLPARRKELGQIQTCRKFGTPVRAAGSGSPRQAKMPDATNRAADGLIFIAAALFPGRHTINSDVRAINLDVTTIKSDVQTLKFDVLEIKFDVFGLKIEGNPLIFDDLCKKPLKS